MTNWLPQLNINFHNITGVEIYTDTLEAQNFFASEYQYHLVDIKPDGIPSVTMRFRQRNSLLPNSSGYTTHTHKLLARWGYRIQLSKDHIELDVIGNQMSIAMVHHMLLHHSIRYLAAQQGVLMLHAGAISHNGRSLIFSGKGGTGKTTTTSLLLAQGGQAWSLHADDYVFLGPGSKSLAYLTRCHLYRDLLKWVPEIEGRLTRSERRKLEVYGRLRSWSKEGIKLAVRLPVERLWPDNAPQFTAVPAAFLLLDRSDVSQLTISPVAELETPLSTLISMNFSEARHFLQLVKKNRAVTDFAGWLGEWKQIETQLLSDQLANTAVYRLSLPVKSQPTPQNTSALLGELEVLSEKELRADVQPTQ